VRPSRASGVPIVSVNSPAAGATAGTIDDLVPGSFRDPHGFVYRHNGVVLRQVNERGRGDYDALMRSGLYETLTSRGELIPHEELEVSAAARPGAYRVLRPEQIPFISYPYEWSFGQLKDAALLTLRLQKAAMDVGLSLRDATSYNVQFHHGRPVWIDTLSFEPLIEGRPWVAYRQFCEFFLAPLALMGQTDVRLQQLLRGYIDGIPIDLAARLLPRTTYLKAGLLTHVHLHGAAQRRHAGSGTPAAKSPPRMSLTALRGLVDSLDRTVQALDWTPTGTVWADYYTDTNYTESAFAHKQALVEQAIDRVAPETVWDLGANDGTFSRLASRKKIRTLAFDVDPAAVEKNYRRVRDDRDEFLLPLLLDLTNPPGGFGWANQERMALTERGPADLVIALALVHHLAIGHNVPLPQVAQFLASLGRTLVVEFVPKADSQVQRMLASRDDIFDGYTQEGFETAFGRWFQILDRTPVGDSQRRLYTMRAV